METTEIRSTNYYCTAKEVMEMTGCGLNKAYRIIRSLRNELVQSGKLTPEYPNGRVPRKYLEQRLMIM